MSKELQQNLLTATQDGDVIRVKKYLESLPADEKGTIFELYLAELFIGSGWLVNCVGGQGDEGADILLYHPKFPNKVSLIVQAKNTSRPLTFDDTKLALLKFEEKATQKYECHQFNLVSINGFVKEAKKLSDFNMLLSGWQYISSLIKKYKAGGVSAPEIQLYNHNENTYEKLCKLWLVDNYVAVVQATGTGKSYLIAKVIADHLDKNIVVMAPSKYVLEQQKEKVPWASSSTVYMTYAKAARLRNDEIVNLNSKLIVLDEFHRCGAKVWGAGVQRILDAYSNAFVLGTTATPVRYLENNRDMSDELFGGVIAEDLSLSEAIVKRILPAPKYVTALYTLDEEIDVLRDVLENSGKSNEEKTKLASEIEQVRLNWEKTSGIPEILKKHLSPELNKFIVFCTDQKHLDEMEWVVESWFQKANIYKRRKKYRVISDDHESDESLDAFRDAKSNKHVHLLFAIDMLNEGLHISDVSGVILLRPTESPIVFYQQIGRCIQVDKKHTPIIFDFVNNFRSIKAKEFIADLAEARKLECDKRLLFGLEESVPEIQITDESQEIEKILEQISEKLGSWMTMYEELIQHKEEFGDCNVPNKYEANQKLGNWVGTQRLNKDFLSSIKTERLDAIGFDWNPLNTRWNQRYAELVAYKEKFGNCNVPHRWKNDLSLASWVREQRANQDKLSFRKHQKLDSIGFDWDRRQTQWDQRYKELIAFRERFGHCNVPGKYQGNPKLGNWVGALRNNIERLSSDQIEHLDNLGFDWNILQARWNQRYEELIVYKGIIGNCNVPAVYKENPQLGRWVRKQRGKKDKLSPEQIEKLEAIGFVWTPQKFQWNQRYKELMDYKKQHGNCNVPEKWDENPQLGRWVGKQRNKKESLPAQQKEKLENIGFNWDAIMIHRRPSKENTIPNPPEKKNDSRQTQWNKIFEELTAYEEMHGNCNVPWDWKENPRLGRWVGTQRRSKDTMTQERMEQLDAIHFDWKPVKNQWNHMYEMLASYMAHYGDCNVPARWKENQKLASWVSIQRRNKDSLTDNQIGKLEILDLDWSPLESRWNRMYEELIAYKKKFGDCKVPHKWVNNRSLGAWVGRQRQIKDSLAPEKVNKLDALGFDWNPYETFRNRMYHELVSYKEEYGDCNVPAIWKENPQLGRWVYMQRSRKDSLTAEQIEKLDAIGFDWKPGTK